MGIEGDVEVDTWSYPMRAGDVVLLCSDGLTSMIGEELIGQILNDESSLDRAGDQLIAAANDAGGRDNITVVLFRLEDVGGASSGDVDEPTVVGMEPVSGPRRGPRRSCRRRGDRDGSGPSHGTRNPPAA